MAANTPRMRPATGQHRVVSVGPDVRLEFAFDQADANLVKDGQNLVATFGDGAKLTLEGFCDNFGDKNQLPILIVEGHALPGEALLTALHDPGSCPRPVSPVRLLARDPTRTLYFTAGVDRVDRLVKLELDGWTRS